MTLRLPLRLWKALRAEAGRQDTDVTKLINLWLEEKVRELELAK